MCGIWFYLGKFPEDRSYRSCVEALKARGPESTRITTIIGDCIMGFTRLAINGNNPSGMQPFRKNKLHWMCNGEIYNWRELAKKYKINHLESGSDCEVLGDLYEVFADENNLSGFFRELDGVFSIVIVDHERDRIVVARDPYGVRPLFIGKRNEISSVGNDSYSTNESIAFSSELKGLLGVCETAEPFAPGTYQIWSISTKKLIHEERYHTIPWLTNPLFSSANPQGLDMACMALRFALEQAVKKRMMTERPVAALLSGGIDSSLIASLVQKNLKELGLPPLKTFSIGMEGSTDLKYAKKVADWIGSEHHEIILTADDFFSAIPKVIFDIETFDTTTVRASVGNWLVSKAIAEKSDCKVVFNGDGSDEVFGSYLYFYNAPSDRHFEEEVSRLLQDIHYFDVLRSDRTISSHGLEPRTPFLDKQFVAVARSIATEFRRPIKGMRAEKWVLRRAFDDGITLPHDVLWRKKEAFSDGVSSQEKSWYQEIQERVASRTPGWKGISNFYTHLPPSTPEQFYYRTLYEGLFSPNYANYARTCTPYLWMPRWTPGATDPSARTLAIYHAT